MVRFAVQRLASEAGRTHFEITNPSERHQGDLMMDQSAGHMGGWLGGGMWLQTVIAVLAIALVIVMFNRTFRK